MKNINTDEFNSAADFLGKSQTTVDKFVADQEVDKKKKKTFMTLQ